MQHDDLKGFGAFSLRPVRRSDEDFLYTLFVTNRPDLRAIEGTADFRRQVIDQQFETRQAHYGNTYHYLRNYIIERLGSPIGRIALDMGPNEIRIAELLVMPQAHSQDTADGILESVKAAGAARKVPVTVIVSAAHAGARQTYARLGFVMEEGNDASARFTWYPTKAAIQA